ncbi:MAG: hypothetical protein N2663_07240 [Chlorobi bacterium]|nr:hypothetical protein [Chlorobiota bacterium]
MRYVIATLCTVWWIIAQPLQNTFDWTIDPWKPLDNTFIPGLPARSTADKGRISIADGKLVYPDGSRARLYGVTIAGPAVFPDSAQAIAIAQRLRSLGVNLVRLTYFDYTTYNDASIITRSSTSSRGFDSTMLRRFDWFIAQLGQQGIYVSLVLRSARQARRDDGIVGWDSVWYAGRIYSYFLSGYQMVVRDFVRDLLSRRNQFTGIPYRDDPTIAIVELDQDNSLFTQWYINAVFPIQQGGQLSFQHSRMLDSMFVRFALAKYRSAQGVQAAWHMTPRTTANVISNPSFEDAFDNTWQLTVRGDALGIAERDPLDKKDGNYSVRIRIAQQGTESFSIFYRNIAPQLQRYALYRIQLWARTDAARRFVTFAIGNFSIRDTLRQQWKEYTYTFRSNVEGPSEFYVALGGALGDVWIDNVRVSAIEEPALVSGESLSTYTVARSRYNQHSVHSLARWRDNLEFYQTLTESWFEWMNRLIKDTLRCRVLVAPGNQQLLLNDIYASRLLDLPSVGTGWDSPYRRITGATSDSAWYILNDPQLGHRFGGLIYVPARARIAGKPLMLDMFTIPYPHASLSEMTILMPAYLAYQDADVYILAYYAYNRSSLATTWVRDRYGPNGVGTITHYELAGNPLILSALPISSFVFRNNLISPARETLLLEQTREALNYPPYNQNGAFFLASGADSRIPLFRRIAIDSFNASLQSYQPHREIPALADQANVNIADLRSDTDELLWNANDTVLLIRTPRYRAASGVLRGKILDISGINSLTVERLDGGWIGSIEALSLDSLSLDSTRVALLSVLTRVCAKGAIWSGDSSTYRGWGSEPMQMEGMNATITWRHTADSLIVIPLDSSGRPISGRARGIAKTPSGRFRLTLDQRADRAVWYTLHFLRNNVSPVVVSEQQRIRLSTLSDRMLIESHGFEPGTPIVVALHSLDGRCIERWESCTRAGTDSYIIALPPLSAGVYIATATVGTQTAVAKTVLAP